MREFWLAIGPGDVWQGFHVLSHRRYSTPFNRVFAIADLHDFCGITVAEDVTPIRETE